MNDLLDDMFDTEGVSVVRPTIIDIWKTISVELEDMWVITNIEWDKKYEIFFDRDVVKGISDFKLTDVSFQKFFQRRHDGYIDVGDECISHQHHILAYYDVGHRCKSLRICLKIENFIEFGIRLNFMSPT